MTLTLANDLALALDPAQLMAQCGLVPDSWQANLLCTDAQRLLLLCSRQAGKSTVTSILALHEALYRPPALVLLLSPSMRQSTELLLKVLDCYRKLDHSVASEMESALRLELTNGSRIISLPGKEETIRGFSGVSLLVIDEASRVPDDLYFAVRPMLAVSGGRLVALSTPFGKRGWFHKEWTEGQDWHRVKITAQDCPRISPVFLEQERQSMPPLWFASEYLCEFVETEDTVFRHEDIQAMFETDAQPLFGGKR